MRRDLERSPPLAAPTLVENGGLPQPAIALAVITESMPNSWVTLTLFASSNFGPSITEARSPSPQVAPVEATVRGGYDGGLICGV
jgi:hypothetical protein